MALTLLAAAPIAAQEVGRRPADPGTPVVRERGARIVAGGAVLEIQPGSVSAPTYVTVASLTDADLVPLDPGMTNVTGGGVRGHRFGPHGARFEKSLRLSLDYDPRLLPPGMTDDDVLAYYFDETRARWVALERVEVKAAAHTVVSLTDHFTDIIVATLATPAHPEVESFAPTMLQDLEAASPREGLDLIAPPEANSLGEVRLSYPIELPPGRQGMQPMLALQYLSQGGNDWLGVGWTMQLPQVEVEVRWGVPRYGVMPDAAGGLAYRDLETESYLLDGQALTPVAHRAPFVPRSGDTKVFHARVETEFEHVVRHGRHPDEFWWEVTDKNGVRSFYGDVPGMGAGPATLRDDAGNVFRWALREMRDPHGNAMRFEYDLVNDPGVPGGSVPGRQLYLRSIDYTGRAGASGYQPGAYRVRFLRDSDPGVSPRVNRRDVSVDCRGGFKQVTADVLRRIRVELLGERIREYELTYDEGAFGRTRLVSVRVLGADGRPLPGGEHRFTWFDDVRDGAGGYTRGFAAPSAWQVPDDDLSLCTDLGPMDVCPSVFVPSYDRASALGGAITHSVGGHLYLGVSCIPNKRISGGGKVGFEYTRTKVESALLDVNGDNLPDKVFRSGSGLVYRANEARPGGRTGFSQQTRPVTGVDELSIESMTSGNGGAEVYAGLASALANASYGQSLGTTYSTDANGDGLLDIVQDGVIHFSHLDANGDPVFEPTSANTPMPLAAGNADGGGLIGDYEPLFQDQVDQQPLVDVFRRWMAPFDGVVRISGGARLVSPNASEDGVRVSVQLNGGVLWATRIPAGDGGTHDPTGLDAVPVRRGDRLYFRLQSVFEGSADEVEWDPEIRYMGSPVSPDANRLDVFRYRASEDFVLAGRASRAAVPYGGRVHVTGLFEKRDTTSDDVTVSLRRNDTEVFHATLPWDSTGDVTLDVSFDVAGDDTSTYDVDESDLVDVRIVVDSPIDVRRVGWRADSPPIMTYESVNGATTRPTAGSAAMEVLLPSDMDLYPRTEPVEPQVPWVAPEDGRVRVDSHLDETWTFRRIGMPIPLPDGELTFTVKRDGALLAKRVLQVRHGLVENDSIGTFDVEAGDRLFFDVSMREAGLRGDVAATVTWLGGPVPVVDGVPCALHSNLDFDDVPTLGRGLYGQPYRGWTYAGVNGNPEPGSPERPKACERPRPAPTQPIDESVLVMDPGLHPPSPSGPRADEQPCYVLVPMHERLPDGSLRASWRGPNEPSWVQPGRSSASRLGAPSIGVPCPSDIGGAPGEDHRAVPRIGNALAGALGLGYSVGMIGGTVGRTGSDLDFLDMNGDQFPDLVAHQSIQYTLPDGGLEPRTRAESALDTLRRAFNLAGSVGGSLPQHKGGSRGTAGADNQSAPKGERSGSLMPPLGISVEGGLGSSTTRVDLIDVNGDGLPDRVTDEGTVALNLGYSFAAPEAWPGFDGLDRSTSKELTLALGLGFNDGIYGYAGGLSYNWSGSNVRRSLLDLNGDGLPDMLREDGGELVVAFNAGSRFLPETRWLGARVDELGSSITAALGGGFFFTVAPPIFMCSPVTPLYLIINPGATVGAAMARQETAIVDVDGDQCADLVTSKRDDEMSVARNRTGRTNLLAAVERPLGGRLAFDYQRLGNSQDLPQSHWVLSRVEVDDGVHDDGPSPLLTTYAYAAPRFDRGEREFYGFGEVAERQCASGDPSRVLRVVTRHYRNGSYYDKGLIADEATGTGDGRVLRGSHFDYEFRDVHRPELPPSLASRTATVFPMLTRAVTSTLEGGPAPGIETSREYAYDADGNVVHVRDTGGAGPEDDIEATIRYASCAPDGVRSMADRIVVQGARGTLAEREATVDCATGDLTQLRERLADGRAAVTDLTYFDDGSLHSLTGPANLHGQRDELHYEYDPVVGTHPTRIEDAFGLSSTTTWDLRFAQPTRITDANGQVTSYAYDPFGRTVSVTGPYEQGTGRPTLEFDYHPEAPVPWAHTRHADVLRGPGDPIETWLFTDGFGRAIQTKVDATVHRSPAQPAEDVLIVSGRARHDDLGRPVEQFRPLTAPRGSGPTFDPRFDPTPPDRVEYDALDRPTVSVRTDGSTTRFRYGLGTTREGARAQETEVEDANGRRRWTYRDATRSLVAVREGTGGPWWTSYDRDGLDRLVSITDPLGHVTRFEYDQLGRRVRLERPDAGETRYGYDLASNLVTLRTARHLAEGGEIRRDYDHTRLVAVRHPDDPDVDVTYEYGAAGAPGHAAGRIVRTTDEAGEERLEYGRLGEVVRRDRVIVGHAGWNLRSPQSFTTRFRYDTWGRLLELTNPDGERIVYDYDAGGLVRSVRGTGIGKDHDYVRRLEYDRFRQQAFVELGNGVRTSYEYRLEDQRLARLTSRGPSGEFQDLRYGYDPVGNLAGSAARVGRSGEPAVRVRRPLPPERGVRRVDLLAAEDRRVRALGTLRPSAQHRLTASRPRPGAALGAARAAAEDEFRGRLPLRSRPPARRGPRGRAHVHVRPERQPDRVDARPERHAPPDRVGRRGPCAQHLRAGARAALRLRRAGRAGAQARAAGRVRVREPVLHRAQRRDRHQPRGRGGDAHRLARLAPSHPARGAPAADRERRALLLPPRPARQRAVRDR